MELHNLGTKLTENQNCQSIYKKYFRRNCSRSEESSKPPQLSISKTGRFCKEEAKESGCGCQAKSASMKSNFFIRIIPFWNSLPLMLCKGKYSIDNIKNKLE